MSLPTSDQVLRFGYVGDRGIWVVPQANSTIDPLRFGYVGDRGLLVTTWGGVAGNDTSLFFLMF